MRPIQPPRLKLRSARRGRRALWVIKDCEREISTGFGQSERAKTEIALANYITRTRQPSFGDGHPDQVLIGDCLAVYCDKHGPTIARPDGLSLEIERLAEFFGDRHVGDVTAELCRGYVDWRCAQTDRRATVTAGRKIKPTTARRELLTLSAALNWCFRNKRLDRAVVITLPQVAERRERYLTRNEVAALLWAALGFNQDDTQPLSGQPAPRPFHPNRVLYRDAPCRALAPAMDGQPAWRLFRPRRRNAPPPAAGCGRDQQAARAGPDPAAAHAPSPPLAQVIDPIRGRVRWQANCLATAPSLEWGARNGWARAGCHPARAEALLRNSDAPKPHLNLGRRRGAGDQRGSDSQDVRTSLRRALACRGRGVVAASGDRPGFAPETTERTVTKRGGLDKSPLI